MAAHDWRFNRMQIWYELYVCKTAEKNRRLFWNMDIFKQAIVEVVLIFWAHVAREHYRLHYLLITIVLDSFSKTYFFFLCMNLHCVYARGSAHFVSIELEVGTHNRERSYIRSVIRARPYSKTTRRSTDGKRRMTRYYDSRQTNTARVTIILFNNARVREPAVFYEVLAIPIATPHYTWLFQ